MTDVLEKSGALCLRKLFFYENESSYTPQMRLLYLIKHKKNARYISFLAQLMSKNATEELQVLGVENVIVTNLARRRKSKVKYGFDQSELLARKVAEILNFEYVSLFESSMFSKEQKGLDRNQRLKNAKKNTRMKRGACVSGKYVVLVDDIVTTGASMSAATRLLMKAGALGVICLSIASRG